MKTYLVVTLTCPDRPGIVERVTEVVAGHSANWEESRFAHLGGEFAGIVKIGVEQHHAEALAAALRKLAVDQMTVVVKVTQLAQSDPNEGRVLCELSLAGADHEGIVHSVSHFLAERGVNVEAMETEVVAAPISGTPLFHMGARITTPPGLSLAELSDELARIGDELGVDIEIRPSQD